MKIVVLDGYTLNPGDLDWSELKSLGEVQIHERSAPSEIVTRARDAEIVLTNKVPLSAETLASLPSLRYVGVLATGYNIVDTAAARSRGIPVSHVPAYGTRSVAQMTFALILELASRVGDHSASVRAGDWSRCPDFCYWKSPLVELEGLTLGIVGLGRIGKAVAALGKAFGMEVIAAQGLRPISNPEGIRQSDLRAVLGASDIVSLHCPLTEATRHLINQETLGWMKPSAWLINTSRGPLIEEVALADALNSGRIAAAALDVLAVEPPPPTQPLISARNCLITPHVAWASGAARRRLLQVAVENIRAFQADRKVNIVN